MRGVVAGAATTILSQNQSESQRLIGPHSSLQATDNHWLLECEDHGGTTRVGQVAKEMKGYWIKVVGISETRWKGSDQ